MGQESDSAGFKSESILQKAINNYRRCHHYRDTGRVLIEQKEVMTFETNFERDKKFTLRWTKKSTHNELIIKPEIEAVVTTNGSIRKAHPDAVTALASLGGITYTVSWIIASLLLLDDRVLRVDRCLKARVSSGKGFSHIQSISIEAVVLARSI